MRKRTSHDFSWRLKFQRAVSLQEELISCVDLYNKSMPTEIKTESWDGQFLHVSLHVRIQPDDMWSVILGDVVHNYRSALDSLVFAIIESVAHGKGVLLDEKIVKKIAFPMKFEKCDLSKLPEFAEHATETLIDDLTEFQPFAYLNEFVGTNKQKIVTSGHPFAMLNELSNIDKHRKLNFIFLDLDNWAILSDSSSTLVSHRSLETENSWQDYLFEYEFSGGDIKQVPHLLPHFQVGVENSAGLRPAYSLTSLLEVFKSQVGYALNKIESNLEM